MGLIAWASPGTGANQSKVAIPTGLGSPVMPGRAGTVANQS
jgi:hypothetical protein